MAIVASEARRQFLANEGVLDGMGHVSVRDPQRADLFFLARSIAPAQVTAADILAYDLDANPIDARGRASYRERFIYSEVYRLRPDVRAVVHCHTPSLIPFADSDVPLRAIGSWRFAVQAAGSVLMLVLSACAW